eukprot:s4165_g5.t1
MQSEHPEVDEPILRQLQDCFRWIECRRDGATHHILFLDADELAQIQEITWMHQHAICMDLGMTLGIAMSWRPGEWGIIDVKRHAAIKGGGKLQKRMLAMLFLFSQAVKSNRISDLPRWWTQTGYVGKLLTHFAKTSKISRSGRSGAGLLMLLEIAGCIECSSQGDVQSAGPRGSPRPVLLVAAARNKREKEDKEVKKDEEFEEEDEEKDEEMKEASCSPSERRVRKKRKKKSKKSKASSRSSSCECESSREHAKRAVVEKMREKAQNAEVEKLKKELAEARAAQAKLTEEKEAALVAARLAQDAEEEALREKDDAISAAQAAAEAEEKARHDLEHREGDACRPPPRHRHCRQVEQRLTGDFHQDEGGGEDRGVARGMDRGDIASHRRSLLELLAGTRLVSQCLSQS